MNKTQVRSGIGVILALSLFACGGGKQSQSMQPDWVMKGGAAFKDAKKTFYGVGVAEGIQSEALRRTTADTRAVEEISRQVSAMSTSLIRDYMSNASVPAEEKASEEQYIEVTRKTFTDNMLSGARPVDRYQSSSGTFYSLWSLDIDQLKSMADQVKNLSGQVRDHIKANAENAFDKMAEEQAKNSKP